MYGGKLHNFRRKCGGKEHRLPLFWHHREYALYLRQKAHVEHAVGFVQNEYVCERKRDGLLQKVVIEAAGGCDYNVRVGLNLSYLVAHRVATDYKCGAQVGGLSYLMQCLFNLVGKLTRGQEYKPAASRPGQALQKRDAEGQGLSRAGLRHADNILALYSGRYCHLLYWSRGFKITG